MRWQSCHLENMRKLLNKLFGIVCLFFAGIALLVLLYGCWLKYKNSQYEKEIENIQELFASNEKDAFSVDWNGLLAECDDVIGWIRMDPDISYPIVYSGDNDFYLRRGLNGEYNPNGSLFMDGNNQTLLDARVLIYGHNMRNRKMFGSLREYQNPSYVKDHDIIRLYTPDGCCRLYRIFSVLPTEDGSWAYRPIVTYGIDVTQFLAQASENSSYWNNELVQNENVQILSLSTCRGQSGGRLRLMINAVYIGNE